MSLEPALKQRAYLANRMGQLVADMGDRGRAETLYRESARLLLYSGTPLFNLALLQRDHREYKAAIQSIEEAINREGGPSCRVLRAMLAEDTGNKSVRSMQLKLAQNGFGPLESLSDWELHWYGKAVMMQNAPEAKAEQEAEKIRRAKPAEKPVEGVLPARKDVQVAKCGR